MLKSFFLSCLMVLLSGSAAGQHESHAGHHQQQPVAAQPKKTETVWTCSMHPQIKLPQPGKCPVCHMDLIELKADTAADDSAVPVLTLSPYAEKLAEVQTAEVQRKFIPHELPLNGYIDYDEGSIADIALRFSGRIDKLYVNYTGIRVRRGDHIAEVFSPELAIMQNEYLSELRTARNTPPAQQPLRTTFAFVKNKMLQWGFTEEQIEEIGRKGTVSENLTVNAPITGTVIEKQVVEGQYFTKEERLFRIADLTRLWLILDVYEMDLPFLHYGQQVEFRADAWPGENFHGTVSYISPTLNARTRTIPVRVNLANPDGKLKPGMYVKATVRVVLDRHGHVIDDKLAGKWISPMHPEIIRDKAGKCDVCGMDLVTAESLGYAATPSDPGQAPLVIPASAPLITGRRAVVYVRTAPGRYEGRQVALGPKAGAFYLVRSGLNEGDEVVTVGNMKIDGAMQISGRASMTSPENFDIPEAAREKNTASHREPVPEDTPDLTGVFRALLALHPPLVKSDAQASAKALAAVRLSINGLPEASPHRGRLLALFPEKLPADIGRLRAIYGQVSDLLSRWSDAPGFKKPALKYHRFYCPMAFDDKGGVWFQDNASLENPYFGAAMLKCGMEK